MCSYRSDVFVNYHLTQIFRMSIYSILLYILFDLSGITNDVITPNIPPTKIYAMLYQTSYFNFLLVRFLIALSSVFFIFNNFSGIFSIPPSW